MSKAPDKIQKALQKELKKLEQKAWDSGYILTRNVYGQTIFKPRFTEIVFWRTNNA